MSDNLKTWPEKIYLDGRLVEKEIRQYSDELDGVVSWFQKPIYTECIEYVRADVVSLMIRDAYVRAAGYCSDHPQEVAAKYKEREAKLLAALQSVKNALCPHVTYT